MCHKRRRAIINFPHAALATLNTSRQTAFYPEGRCCLLRGNRLAAFPHLRWPSKALCEFRKRTEPHAADGGAGEVLCLSSLIADEPYPVTAETLCPSQVGFLPRLAFLQLMRAHPGCFFPLRVAKHLSMEISEAWQRRASTARSEDRSYR